MLIFLWDIGVVVKISVEPLASLSYSDNIDKMLLINGPHFHIIELKCFNFHIFGEKKTAAAMIWGEKVGRGL